jgi:glycosyltransferase involved in cell wall biosynthesis
VEVKTSKTIKVSPSNCIEIRGLQYMSDRQTLVSIGMPIFNGEKYIRDTLDSLLDQTFNDFEIIICDNQSTDNTEAICEEYALRDKRINYYKNPQNLGPAKNYNRVFRLSNGKYFKWASYDDLYMPHYLEKCVNVLEQNPDVAVCYPRVIFIDGNGQEIRKSNSNILNLDSSSAVERFRTYHQMIFPRVLADKSSRKNSRIRMGEDTTSSIEEKTITQGGNSREEKNHEFEKHPSGDRWTPIFGLIRRDVLEKTPKIASYVNSDVVLLGELSLAGRYHEVPEHLFLYRDHSEASGRSNKGYYEWSVWFDPENQGKVILPLWQQFFEFIHAINRSGLSIRDKFSCLILMSKWGLGMRVRLAKELIIVSLTTLNIREINFGKYKKKVPSQW